MFSGQMVRAILEGRKTQTRRLKKLRIKDKYGCVGDTLWVREKWAVFVRDGVHRFISYASTATSHEYDHHHEEIDSIYAVHDNMWRPSMYMPRWASRITLQVTDIRDQMLQDISEEDAKAEGFESVESFAKYWDGLNSNICDRFVDNPPVWAITFKRIV